MQPQQPPQPPHHPVLGQVPSHLSLSNITTEQIQKYLDENKQLILAILDNQNLGKLSECAQYQAQLQKNLLYLAAIADAQPQIPAVRTQMLPHPAMQQAGHYMQQAPMFSPRPPMPFNPQQMQLMQQQPPSQHQFHQLPQIPVQGHVEMRPGIVNGMHAMHGEATLGMNSSLPPSSLSEFPKGAAASSSSDVRGNKQEANAGAESAPNDHQTPANEHGSGDKEPPLQKRVQDGKTP
uniref:Protein SSXT n=1 Tax=Anthurium amnicola TaxID=1678845 RepID=A0A1D1YRK5_9ARAE